MIYTIATDRLPPKPATLALAEYFHCVDGQTVTGPVSKRDLRSALKRKLIEKDTPVFCPATQAWYTFNTLAELPLPSIEHFILYSQEPSLEPVTGECSQLIDEVVSGKKSQPSACADLMQILRKHSYVAPDFDSGSLNDLLFHDRLQLIIETNVAIRRGIIGYNSSCNEITMDINPARELVKVGDDYERTDWRQRWVQAGGQLRGKRMIAPRTATVWTKLSRFGLPFAPFDYLSGVTAIEVGREDADRFGIDCRFVGVPALIASIKIVVGL